MFYSEMLEAVGHEYMEEFFGCCESVLAEDGLLVLQVLIAWFQHRRLSMFWGEPTFSNFSHEPNFGNGSEIHSLVDFLSWEWQKELFCKYHILIEWFWDLIILLIKIKMSFLWSSIFFSNNRGCLIFHFSLVHIDPGWKVRWIQKKLRFYKGIHFPWWMLAFIK